jgi:glycosyltransferase involved in cell wall biosynthesis
MERWGSGKPVAQFIAWTQLDMFLTVSCSKGWQGPPEVIYVGVVSRVKGLHHLLNSFAGLAHEYPESKLVIVGPVYDRRYNSELQQRADWLGLAGRVEFVGEVDQQEVALRMASATVLVLPSLTEGLGRVVLEAMAAGTPVVASAVGGIPEIVKDGFDGLLVEPGEESALEGRLRWIFENRQAAYEMGRRGRQRAAALFSPIKFKQAYGALFEMAEDARVSRRGGCVAR